MTHWAKDAIFYHLYPLGACAAPRRNDFTQPPEPRLEQLYGWLDHWQGLGMNALYLGPLFESSAHGYDTADYYAVDRRLGMNDTLTQFSRALHARGIRLVLDGVFNHVGRDFWAFRDVQERGMASPYCEWFAGLRFDGHSPYGDPFTYEAWNGHFELVRLNVPHPAVREHLFEAVRRWVDAFEIDGLRLDVADCLDLDFQRALAAFCRGLRSDFWLMGEVIHGDYRRWANPDILDSVTNYECYKGLYSSLNDRNYFEIAYALNRQFGAEGLYRDLSLYAFADNHDVNRVASTLHKPTHLYPLYALLFTMPGVPSIYYGSEWGLTGQRDHHSDAALRPALDAGTAQSSSHRDLAPAITRLAHIRRESPALRHGDYQQLHVSAEQLAFMRTVAQERVIVALNASDVPVTLELPLAEAEGTRLVDVLNPGETFTVHHGRVQIAPLYPNWARILVMRRTAS